MPDHGRLFDNFTAAPSHTHGGSYFDAGFGLQTLQEAHGKLFDLFGVHQDTTGGHGERYDEFGWTAMPALHGQNFDSDFRRETALDGSHGTWFDAFRGGTQVRYMLEGADYEGTVIECRPDHAVVRSRAGQTHEIGLSQFLAYRTPNEQQASPGLPQSDAEAPSAHSEARGGGRHSVSPELPPKIEEAPQGQYTEPRTGVPAGAMDTFTHLKSLVERYEADDVVKAVDATETAVQGQPTVKTVGHRNGCPRGGSAPCGVEADGRCSICRAEVHDHDAVGKATTGDLGIKVPDREHKTTDHHTTGEKPGVCPHCGAALELNDHQTEQGAPQSRKDKQGAGSEFDTVTHKCLGTGIDVLKQLAAA